MVFFPDLQEEIKDKDKEIKVLKSTCEMSEQLSKKFQYINKRECFMTTHIFYTYSIRVECCMPSLKNYFNTGISNCRSGVGHRRPVGQNWPVTSNIWPAPTARLFLQMFQQPNAKCNCRPLLYVFYQRVCIHFGSFSSNLSM